ncbi:hypothetical protein AB0I55_22365 [Actinocatenispora sera]|uniref:hypothetical protein n=1 Tax=Actinocatenispora sera TaxID=390989 RepID=UPI0033E2283D
MLELVIPLVLREFSGESEHGEKCCGGDPVMVTDAKYMDWEMVVACKSVGEGAADSQGAGGGGLVDDGGCVE